MRLTIPSICGQTPPARKHRAACGVVFWVSCRRFQGVDVGFQLPMARPISGFGQVDEAVDPRIEQRRRFLVGLGMIERAGVLARREPPGNDPVAVCNRAFRRRGSPETQVAGCAVGHGTALTLALALESTTTPRAWRRTDRRGNNRRRSSCLVSPSLPVHRYAYRTTAPISPAAPSRSGIRSPALAARW